VIRIGTRGSDLALTQTRMVAQLLERLGHKTELVVIQTSGDATDRPFKELEGKAFFTKELDDALLTWAVDLAIHSLKDLPTDDPPGLATTSVLPRADPRDRLLLRVAPVHGSPQRGAPLLRAGMRVGTSSTRRAAQLKEAFPGIAALDLRGNVPTRVQKLRRGDYDAIVLAAAGLDRLGLDLAGLSVHALDPPEFLPAPGQGVLAARYRADDPTLPDALRPLIDVAAAECSRAERLVLAKRDRGCSLPLGALARRRGDAIELLASLEREGRIAHAHVRGRTATEAADAAVRALTGAPTIVVTRPSGLDDELCAALADAGFRVASQPAIRFAELPEDATRRALLAAAGGFDVVAFTSRAAVRAFARAVETLPAPPTLRTVAAVGAATARALEAHGFAAGFVGDGRGAESLARALATALPPRARILHPGPLEPEPAFARALADGGFTVAELPLYATVAITDDPPLPAGPVIALLASPSAARAFLAREHVRARLERGDESLLFLAGGATTAAELERLGARVAAVARTPGAADVVAALTTSRFQESRP
jgi:hydroxymethylbilane synthase